MLLAAQLTAQDVKKVENLETIENQVFVNGSPEAVWNALSSYGNVSSFHSVIDDSMPINGSVDKASLGSEREVQIPDGINNIIFKERIVNFSEGIYYTYEVFESENFPTKRMKVTYGVRLDEKGRTILYSKTAYKLSNILSTKFLKRKLDKANNDSLLAYKYFIETGERNTDLKILRKRYLKEVQDGASDYFAVNQ